MSVCPPIRRTFSDERGTGTFHTLGVLPKRSRGRSPVFHIPDDDDDDHASPLDEHHDPPPSGVHFPTIRSSSPPSSETSSSSTPRPASPCSPMQRGASAPVFLSNGKPLKSSLKGSCSPPAMVIPPQPQQMHLRARSEPSTPKNVHFPEEDYGLATIRVFNRSARPAALSSPANGNGDETETEGEDTLSNAFPFPPYPSVSNYEIDPTKSSLIPSMSSSPTNLLLESLNLSQPPASCLGSPLKPLLTGSILVRNLAFEKHVAVRFTLDDWQTVSEVAAHYIDSLSTPLSDPRSPSSSTDRRGRGWDRFAFTIRLEDYAHSLSTRTMWLAVRYRITSTYPEPGSSLYGPGGEWWDNNSGSNYRVGFRAAIPATPRSRPRRETVSVPITRSQPLPPTTCTEHASNSVLPFFSRSKEARQLTPLRTGKLSLCNYAPPTARASSAAKVLTPSVTDPSLPHSSDESSPPSSTLSTPSVSPMIVPRVIIGGQPATPCNSSDREDNEITVTKPGYVVDWDWSALGKRGSEGSSPQHINPAPTSERQGNNRSPPGRQAVSDNNALRDAFVRQWCFAQGPSLNHYPYDGCGIMT